jgi:3-hydroxyisobutyrate dehydrogenase-like beta-hydroxyacid dehydrogenase
MKLRRLAIIGFGEVGQILAADLHSQGAKELVAWDIIFPAAREPHPALAAAGVHAAVSAADAVTEAELVISAVTAAQTVEAARAASAGLEPDAYFLDLNSVSPQVKQEAAQIIATAGGRYVEAAVMSPVPPRRLATPMLLGGPDATAFLPVAQRLGFTGAEVFSHEIGRASAAKMCRSVMVKGIEALLTESLLTARRYGVEDAVLESLGNLLPSEDWRALARYMIGRSILHGRRRAEEMREVARTVSHAGLAPVMSRATAERQDWTAQYGSAADAETLEGMLDAILRQATQSLLR